MEPSSERDGIIPRHRGLLISLATALMFLGSSVPALAARSVYVTNSGESSVSQYTIAAGGQLVPKSPAKVKTGKTPMGVVVSPNAKYLYVADEGANAVSQFTIDARGRLHPMSPDRVAAGSHPRGIAISPDGLSVYVADSGNSQISQYDVGADGALTPKTNPTVPSGPNPYEVAVQGTTVRVTNHGCSKPGSAGCADTMSQYTISPTGDLVRGEAPTLPPTLGGFQAPTGLAMAPLENPAFTGGGGHATYVSGSCGQGCHRALHLYDPLSGHRHAFGTGASDAREMVVGAGGSDLYLTNAQGVRHYRLEPHGGHVLPQTPQHLPVSDPKGLALSPSERALYVAGASTDAISQYRVGSEGELSPMASPTVPSGSKPFGVAVTVPHLTATRIRSLPGNPNGTLTRVDGTAFLFTHDSAPGSVLWRSDGTPEGSVRVKRIGEDPEQPTAVGHLLFFTASDSTHGTELWRSDGTRPGTKLVEDVNPGTSGSEPSQLTEMGGALYFIADDGTHGPALWRSDGTASGTELVKDVGLTPFNLTATAGKLFFFACSPIPDCTDDQPELWVSDGTTDGTQFVAAPTGRPHEYPVDYGAAGGLFWFVGTDSTYGDEPWRSDGTAAGTFPIDLCPGSCASIGENGGFDEAPTFPDIGGRVLIAASLGTNPGIWASDGSASGTKLVTDVQPYTTAEIATAGERAFFAVRGQTFWTTDGTPSGTRPIKLVSLVTYHPFWTSFGAVGKTLFFSAPPDIPFWSSDGTFAGTQPVSAPQGIAPAYRPHGPTTLADVGGVGLFTGCSQALGCGLWSVAR